ncbi:SDR family NAD(P)-dependent oxidoreductase [Martelella alba]|nr:SDR family oxidoreductase [Martelella alba]
MKTKNYLITGASGIGLSVAARFISAGARVCFLSRTQASVDAAIGKLGKQAIGVAGSVTETSPILAAIDRMHEEFGGIDGAITCAGINEVQSAFDVSAATFRKILDINVLGSFLVAQAVGKSLAANSGGAITFMSSVYGEAGAPQRAAYCASKGALHTLVESLAIEWGPLGIRVNAVAPTGVRSAMVQSLIEAGKYNLPGVKARTPLGRLAEPEEIADACFFLASDQAKMISGHVLPVDGGWLANGYIL